MNRLEMAQKLFKNPKLEARSNFDEEAYVQSYSSSKRIAYKHNHKMVGMYCDSDEVWEIIEPKLKEFTFGEMIHILFKSLSVVCSQCKSVVTNLDYTRDMNKISIEEYDGKWTIEGYYEE